MLLIIWFSGDVIPAYSQDRVCERPFEAVSTSLDDLGNNEYLRMDGTETAFTGGLYQNGSNLRPFAHNAMGIALGNDIVPLGTDGQPNTDGRIVMISVGMSNAAQEFRDFVEMTKTDPEINPLLAVVNGAQPGEVSGDWVDLDAETWIEIDRRLNSGGLAP